MFSRSKYKITFDDAHRAVDAATRPYMDVDLYGLVVGERALKHGAYIIRALGDGFGSSGSKGDKVISMVIALGVDRY